MKGVDLERLKGFNVFGRLIEVVGGAVTACNGDRVFKDLLWTNSSEHSSDRGPVVRVLNILGSAH